MDPVVVTLTNPVPVGIPLIVIVFATASVTAFKPAGILTRLIPVAEPPY